MTVYDGQRTFRCNVGASVQSPTPDPDRPHCIAVNIYNTYTNGTRNDEAQLKLILHSKFPIYTEFVSQPTYYDPNFNYLGIVLFFERDGDSRFEFDCEAYLSSDNDPGRNRFQIHNLDLASPTLASGALYILYDRGTGNYQFRNARVLSEPFTLQMIREGTSENALETYTFYYLIYTKRSNPPSQIPGLSATSDIDWWPSPTSANPTGNKIVPYNTEYDVSGSHYYRKTTCYNFNNPTFNSIGDWFAYCKEHTS